MDPKQEEGASSISAQYVEDAIKVLAHQNA